MAITSDGSQKFAITATQLSTASGSFIVESFSRSSTSNRVDLDDGNGEPIGSTIVPQREEVSFTVQVGAAANTLPVIGEQIVYDSVTYLLTDVEVAETQADYQRLNISGYKKIN